MPFQNRITHAATVAKWKVDQQTRIFNIQNQIHDLENKIRAKKAELADQALVLYQNNQISEEPLKMICLAIDETHRQIEAKHIEEEHVKHEQAPEMEQYSTKYPPQTTVTGEKSGLVCPQCGRELLGKFCPIHGVEGVPKVTPIAPPSEGTPIPVADQLVCPKCHKPLRGIFCPEHGLEGVPFQPENPLS
jgi:hypothetical protein